MRALRFHFAGFVSASFPRRFPRAGFSQKPRAFVSVSFPRPFPAPVLVSRFLTIGGKWETKHVFPFWGRRLPRARRGGMVRPMSTVAEIEEAVAKLPAADFARLGQVAQVFEQARAALAEIEAGEKPAPLDEVAARLGLQHRRAAAGTPAVAGARACARRSRAGARSMQRAR